jgi:hypothetical protein
VTPPAGDCGPSGSAAISACSSASLCEAGRHVWANILPGIGAHVKQHGRRMEWTGKDAPVAGYCKPFYRK